MIATAQSVRRGEVYFAQLSPTEGSEQAGIRPVVIVSRDAINEFGSVVVVCSITDAIHKRRIYPSHVKVKAGAGGLRKESVVLTEQVRAISKTRLKTRLGIFDRATMIQVESALKITLDLA